MLFLLKMPLTGTDRETIFGPQHWCRATRRKQPTSGSNNDQPNQRDQRDNRSRYQPIDL
jgi:hypothetical protein